MNTCEKYDQMLWLDVYGELPQEKNAELKHHINACPVCREKAEELHGLIMAVRETAPLPGLSGWESQNLTRTVMRSLKKETEGWHGFPAFFRTSFVPSVLTACLLLFFGGWFGIQQWQGRPADMLKAEEMQIIKNYEMISNLDLLEDMDDVEKVVKTVDQKKYGELSQKRFLVVRKADGNEKQV